MKAEAAIIGLIGMLVVAGVLRAADDVPPPLRVVTTYSDLLQQQPITLEGGVKVRVGMQADHCEVDDGILVYCLTDDAALAAGISRDGLGPLRLMITRKNGQQLELGTTERINRVRELQGQVLFAKSVVADDTGKVRITLRDGARTIAEGMVTAGEHTGEAMPAWLKVVQRPQQIVSGSRPMPLDVTMEYEHRALPKWAGDVPMLFKGRWGEEKIDRPVTEKLPTFLPEGASLKLTADGPSLTVRSDEPMEAYTVDDHWLARWWVNSKPYVPTRAARMSMRQQVQRPQGLTKELVLKIDLNNTRLGARSGDKLAVQLLYCTDSVRRIADERIVELLQTDPPNLSRMTGTRVRISNPVEFFVP